jgi:hypothetical protein
MRFIWRDTSTWTPLLDKTRGHRQTPESMVQAVREIYDHLTVFHAARPQSVEAYYREGLQLADHQKLTATAEAIFLSGEFPEIDGSAFQTAVQGITGIDNRRVYVTLDERESIHGSGHYLCYGSEYLIKLAASLSRNCIRDYRQVLKRFGRPTIFTISLPINRISESDILQFGTLLRSWLPRIRAGRRSPEVDFTFTLRMALSGNCVLAHEHPHTIRDPFAPR